MDTPSFSERWNRFWFQPESPIVLDGMRMGFALLVLVWLSSFMGYQAEFFSMEGWMDAAGYMENSRLSPESQMDQERWSPMFMIANAQIGNVVYFASMAIVLAYFWGVATRITSVLTWLVIATFTASPLVNYEGDRLLGIFAFYLMVGYLIAGDFPGNLFSLRGSDLPSLLQEEVQSKRGKSHVANLAVRCLQVHLAIGIFLSGMFKLQIGEWWAGDSLWFPYHSPDRTTITAVQEMGRTQAEWMAILFSLGVYAMLVWQISFPFVAWRPAFRWWIVGGGVVAFLGNVFLYRLPVFGPAYLLATLLFLPTSSWQLAFATLGRLPGFRAVATLAR